jgi:2-phosphosulfolactate phosphatase
VVVIIDIFRATSAICTAFAHGVSKIIPVSSIEDARRYQREGYLVAAERNGEVVQGFDIGNSPFHYMDEGLNGKEIVMTTTNGTKAVERARAADHVIVASFLNLTAVVKYLREMNKNVILLCAGWKDRFNLEDTLFAGAVVNQLKRESHFTGLADSSLAADHLYQLAADDVYGFLSNSSHRRRLSRLHLEKDIEFCLQKDEFDKVPYLSGNAIVA